jgi:hypothetical protein
MCSHCGGWIDPATTAMPQPVGRAVVEQAGPGTAVDATAVRAVFAGVLRLLFEVAAGRRPASHIESVADPSVQRYLRAQPMRHLVLRSVRVCFPAEHVAELAAVVGTGGGRVGAVAVRFEQRPGGRWCCVTFRIL